MLIFFVSADNSLTQKEVGPSMWKDRKWLDTMLQFYMKNST